MTKQLRMWVQEDMFPELEPEWRRKAEGIRAEREREANAARSIKAKEQWAAWRAQEGRLAKVEPK